MDKGNLLTTRDPLVGEAICRALLDRPAEPTHSVIFVKVQNMSAKHLAPSRTVHLPV